MAKQALQNRLSKKEGEVLLEQQIISDNNLLPSAEELSKLKAVSPEIVPWILNRAEMEQNARIKFNEDRMDLAMLEAKRNNRYRFTSLIMAFLITITFLALSFLLITNGFEIVGTIFAGGTIAIIVSFFLKRNNEHDTEK